MPKRILPQTPTPDQAAELRAIRQHLGLSQRRFARLLGSAIRSLARWEHGDRPVPMTLLSLARFVALSTAPSAQFCPMISNADQPTILVTSGCECLGYGTGCRAPYYTLQAALSRRRGLEARACMAHIRQAYHLMVHALTDPRVKQRSWKKRRQRQRSTAPHAH